VDDARNKGRRRIPPVLLEQSPPVAEENGDAEEADLSRSTNCW